MSKTLHPIWWLCSHLDPMGHMQLQSCENRRKKNWNENQSHELQIHRLSKKVYLHWATSWKLKKPRKWTSFEQISTMTDTLLNGKKLCKIAWNIYFLPLPQFAGSENSRQWVKAQIALCSSIMLKGKREETRVKMKLLKMSHLLVVRWVMRYFQFWILF